MITPIFQEGNHIEYYSKSGKPTARKIWLVQKVSTLTEMYFLVSTEGIRIYHTLTFLRQFKYKLAGEMIPIPRPVLKRPVAQAFVAEQRNVNAIKFDQKNAEKVISFTGNDKSKTHGNYALTLNVRTGTIVVRPGEWVVSLPDKHFIVLSNRVFNQLYRSV